MNNLDSHAKFDQKIHFTEGRQAWESKERKIDLWFSLKFAVREVRKQN